MSSIPMPDPGLRTVRSGTPSAGRRASPGNGASRPVPGREPVDPFAGRTLTSAARRARRLARDVHRRQVDRHGGSLSEHVERVAGAVPESARAVAFVHDVCERSGVGAGELALLLDFDEDERAALALLTKAAGERLAQHVVRVADARSGPARELALLVLRADVEDHAGHAPHGSGDYAEALALLDAAAPQWA